MSPGQATVVIGTLAVLLAVASAIAGALWYKLRAIPALRATLLARDLVERLQFLEELISRIEQADGSRKLPPHLRTATSLRLDPGAYGPDRQPGPAGPPVSPVPTSPRDVYAPADRLGSRTASQPNVAPLADSPKLIAVPDLAAAHHEPSESDHVIAERFRAIWALADRGFTAEAITRQTGLPIGQVELILGLRRRFPNG